MSDAIYQDMTEIYDNPDKWINHGRNALIENCKHFSQGTEKENEENEYTNIQYSGYCSECDISEDSGIPIMNYLYPLELNSFDEDKILKVVKETNCTILENEESGEWFLALCVGGMNLSQDIALSYIILETWIPKDLLSSVCKQACLSVSKENYKILARQIIEQLKMESKGFKEDAKIWEQTFKEFNLKEKEKKLNPIAN